MKLKLNELNAIFMKLIELNVILMKLKLNELKAIFMKLKLYNQELSVILLKLP